MEVSSCFFKPLDLFLKPPSESYTPSPLKVVNHFASGHNSTFEASTHLGDLKNASAQTIDAIEPLESIVRKPFRSKSTQPGISDSNVVDSQDKSPIKQGSSEVYLKWRKLTLVAQSIHRFKSLRVERIKSAGNLREMIQDTRLTERNFLEDDGALYITPAEKHIDALESFRNQQIFFKYLESAGKKDLVEIQKMLLKDPKAYLYDADSPYRLANRPNHRGYTPLYVACRNGNLELVRLLLKNKANPYQLSLVSPNNNESILLVAARWGHLELVKYLTGKDFVWPETELRKACKEAMESQAKEYLKDQVQKNSKSFFGRFFSF